ncbi:MAG: hypothetical protein ACFFCS_01770 [Candidatus Hodarchaeota archaeon]
MDLKEKLKRAWNKPPKKVQRIYHILLYVFGFTFCLLGIILASITALDPGYTTDNAIWVTNHVLIACAGVSIIFCAIYKHKQYKKFKKKELQNSKVINQSTSSS